jgi:transcriptional regulator with XRE-family HTH domain
MYKDMSKDTEVYSNNNIGSAIQYFRELYHISQSKLCKGLCSVSTLSRIETGERDIDAFILETLLERLGRIPNQFELILNDFDYEAYQSRTEINRLIEEKAIDDAYNLVNEYDKLASDKGSPHKQFVMVCRARLNELKGGEPEATIDMLMEAISCTVPDFNTDELSEYFLSYSEFGIILEILEKLISFGMTDRAHKTLDQIIDYMFWHSQMEQNINIYPKVAAIGSRFLLEQKELDSAMELCDKGIEMNKGSRRIEYLGELNLIKAQITEMKLKAAGLWKTCDKSECISLYLKAYHIFSFFEEHTTADKIKKHLQEEYKWEDID